MPDKEKNTILLPVFKDLTKICQDKGYLLMTDFDMYQFRYFDSNPLYRPCYLTIRIREQDYRCAYFDPCDLLAIVGTPYFEFNVEISNFLQKREEALDEALDLNRYTSAKLFINDLEHYVMYQETIPTGIELDAKKILKEQNDKN